MSSVDMSLDEIIARRRGAVMRSNGLTSRNDTRKRDFAPEYTSTNSAFTKPENVPKGKWDHSGFEEMYGNGSNNDPAPERGERFNRVDLARKVRLHITNLAATVNSADLNELLEEYSIISANVNCNEMGQSLGTADIVTDRVTAKEIVKNLNGVALDGKVMSFHTIDDQTPLVRRTVRVKDRLNFGERSRGLTRGINKRPMNRKFTGFNSPRKSFPRRPQMTDEDLDRELEEYMNKRRNKNRDEQKMEA